MNGTERYVADQTADGMPMVLDTTSTLASIVCRCRTDADAERIARALNGQQEAIDLLRDLTEKWTDVRVSGFGARVAALGDAVRRADEFLNSEAVVTTVPTT